MKGMKQEKALGMTGVNTEMLVNAGRVGLEVLVRVFQEAAVEGIPEDWRNSITTPIYKGKGDALQCAKHRGIRLPEHTMKIYEKVLEFKLRQIVQISGHQFGFVPGRSTIDAIFIMRQLQEKMTEKKKRLFHIFVDLEKALDRIPW